jgi:hypothetical protein
MKCSHSATVVVLTIVAALHASPATAQRAFVAAQGADANPCTFALPCRTFQHAHDVVAAGGEIDVLDPAGYGSLSINKAISIQGHGFSGISVSTDHNGIIVDAAATDDINLNGLLIEGGGVGNDGILFRSGRSLVIENCVIRNMRRDGLAFFSLASTPQTLSVSSSYVTHNTSDGMLIEALGTGAVTAAIERSAFYRNGFGVNVDGTQGSGPLHVTVTDSVAANSTAGGIGFIVQSSAAHSAATLVLTHVAAAANDIGVAAIGSNATVRLGQSTVSGNGTGYEIAGGAIASYGDNYIDDNGTNVGGLGNASKR